MDKNKIIEIAKNLKLGFEFPYSIKEWVNLGMPVENYHSHRDFSNTSTPDCAESVENYALKNKEIGTKCLFSGEHGSQGNHFYVYKVAEKEKLKYRHSTEAYWVKDRYAQDRANCHIILVAKNAEGRRDINYALSIANIEGYYYKPRLDIDLLLNIPPENVIVTSACISGWNYEDAEILWLRLWKHFGKNFYFEVQANNTDKQKAINRKIIKLSKKYGIPIIAGMDTHYITDEYNEKRDQILKYKCISYPEEEGWNIDWPDTETFIERFKEQGILTDEEIIEALMNTNVFVNECEEIVLDKSFKIPSVHKGKTYEEKCEIYKNDIKNAYKKEKLKSREKALGIKFEVQQVIESGVVDYFMTSRKIVEKAIKDYKGVLTTTSRGSAASFVTNKLIGLTTVDRFNSDIPIYAERFLTKERVESGQMPDIDLNVAKQEPFVLAAKEILGEHGCYPLMALSKLKEKAAWQLYAGANDVSPEDSNAISKCLDAYNKKLKYAEEDEKDLILVEDFISSEYIELYKESLDYQGITINLISHPCGYLIFDGDIRREIGLITAISESTGERTLCACAEGFVLDEFGYVKEDFLIVDSVGLTDKMFKAIGKSVPSFDELREMIKDDEKTWDIYARGITCCVNQCEKDATTKRCMKYKPKNLAELAAFIAAIRPGFKSLLNTFLDRQEYSTGEPLIDELLADSSHFMIYQESIMKVLGFLGKKMGETYDVVKSISKKKLKGEKKDELLDELVDSWQKIFANTSNFEKVWNIIEDSGQYAFNSPHAYSMGGDSAYQAWFKAHHTSVFYEVALNHYQEKDNKDKIHDLQAEATKFFGYKIGKFEYGKDNTKFTVNDEEKIIYPNLASVKGIGVAAIQDMMRIYEQHGDDFIDTYLAIKGSKVNNTVFKNLVKIGYFKKFGSVKYLLSVCELVDSFKTTQGTLMKSMNKETFLEKYEGLDVSQYAIGITKAGKESKAWTFIDLVGFIKMLSMDVSREEDTSIQLARYQAEVLGYVDIVDPKVSNRNIIVESLDTTYSPKFRGYVIKTGKYIEFKAHKTIPRNDRRCKTSYSEMKFTDGDCIYIKDYKDQPKKKPIKDANGHTDWIEDETVMEKWLKDYLVI